MSFNEEMERKREVNFSIVVEHSPSPYAKERLQQALNLILNNATPDVEGFNDSHRRNSKSKYTTIAETSESDLKGDEPPHNRLKRYKQ